jgi:hypothetical protein
MFTAAGTVSEWLSANLVAGFTDFVDDRYYSGLRVTGGVRFAGGVSVDRGQQVRADPCSDPREHPTATRGRSRPRSPAQLRAGKKGPQSTKITAELSPQDLLSAFCQVGFVTREAANEGFPRRTPFLARFSSCALRCFPGFAWGIASFLSAADGHWPTPVLRWLRMPLGESLLNVWFRRCSSVVGSSSVSGFA